MSSEALERTFELYPNVRLVVAAHLYGTPGKVEEIKKICEAHDALIVEDAAENLGAKFKLNEQWVETGTLGNYNAIGFNENKVITGSSGGMFLTDSKEDTDKVRKWSIQNREAATWHQHEEIGYNYRTSNIVAITVRGQFPHLDEHIAQKRDVFERYKKGLANLQVKMNPWNREKSIPNFWLSCCIIDEKAMAPMVRGEQAYLYKSESGKSSHRRSLMQLKLSMRKDDQSGSPCICSRRISAKRRKTRKILYFQRFFTVFGRIYTALGGT